MEEAKHFSHEHPLEYVDSSFHKSSVCSACKHTIARNNFFYQCKLCHFSLHKVCFTMPEKVTHPSDQSHSLSLQLPSSPTRQASDCAACGRHIDGFYYSCTECSIYCHMLCVALPLSVKIPSSHPHLLKLVLKLPYDFRCDLCDKPSYSGWLYRCKLCEFDAHVSCAVKGTQSSHQRRVSDAKTHQHEVMELLSEVMKGEEVKNVDHHDDHDQSVSVSGDFVLPSYQFSDACFSIDISNFSRHQVKVSGSKGISSHVWEELGPVDKLKSKNEDNGTTRRSFWSKLLMCS